MGVETLATLSLVAGGVQTAMGVVSSLGQAAASKKNANYQAAIADRNAEMARRNARMEAERGEAAQVQQQMKSRNTIAAITAAQAANGLDINTGSNLDVRTSAESLARVDALNVKNDSVRKAYNFETEAAGEVAQAGAYRAKGDNDQLAGWVDAGSSLVGGAASVGDKYLKYSKDKSISW